MKTGCQLIVLIVLSCSFALVTAHSTFAQADEKFIEGKDEQRIAYFQQLRKFYEGSPDAWPAPTLDEGVEHRELGLAPKTVHPASNPGSPSKIKLGKMLFYDPRLSGSRQIACASCHDPDLGWGDGKATSFGHNRKKLDRNAPSILNSGSRKTLFWDGRASSLEDQAEKVLSNSDEMHAADGIVVENLADIPEYLELFKEVFGDDALTREHAIQAIAAFERTIVSGTSRFDSFLKGRQKALSEEALSGLHLFRTKARCMNCHNGPVMSDDKFHNIGLSNYGRRFEDLGRYKVTKRAEDVGAFRTPSLRNVARTAPYMHNGLFDLDEVLRLYNSGMPNARPRKDQANDPLFPKKSPLLKPLKLSSQELADLRAFLESLSESHRRVEVPKLPAFDE